MIKQFKVYGAPGHRQKLSFCESFAIKDYNNNYICISNADITNTNEYTLLTICGKNENAINAALQGQITDGIFENCRVGKIEEKIINYEY